MAAILDLIYDLRLRDENHQNRHPQKAHDKNAGIMMHCKSVPKLLSHHESRSSHILQLEVVFSLIQRTGFTTYYKKYSVSSPLMSLTAYCFGFLFFCF